MTYVVVIVAGVLYWILGKKLGAWQDKAWFVRPAMLVISSASFANTGLGIWCAHVLRGTFGWAGGLLDASSGLVAGGIGLILLVGTALDLRDHRPDGMAKTGLIMLPLLVLVASGPLASSGAGLFDSISQAGTHGLSSMIGG